MTTDREDLDPLAGLLACYQKALGHELPNLLVAGQGLARLLLMEAGSAPDRRELLERLAQSIQKADGLVRRLAALGRLLRQPLRPEPVPLADLAAEVAAEARVAGNLAPDRGEAQPSIEPTLVGPLPVLRTDRDRLRRVLLELLRNAYQAGRDVRQFVITLEWQPENHELRLQDSGCGIPDRAAEWLREPFLPGTDGPALGLFAAGLLVRALGGSMTPTRVACGTLIRLHLPPLPTGPSPG